MTYPDGFINQVICGDCLEVMQDIPDKSIDLIIADPPYNIKKAEWDNIPNYLEWMGRVFKACERTLKDNGSFYWFHNDMPVINRLMIWLEENTEFIFKQFIAWNKYFKDSKDTGFCQQRLANPLNRNYYSGFTEYVLFYTFQDETGLIQIMTAKLFKPIKNYFLMEYLKAKLTLKRANEIMGLATTGANLAGELFGTKRIRFIFPTKEKYRLLQSTGFFQRSYEDLRREYEDLRREYEDLRYTFNNQRVVVDNFDRQFWNNNIWNYEVAEKQGHLTPKPTRLMENIILHSSNEGALILDLFSGSGTTAIACKNLNRNFIGIEISPDYCEIARRRLEEPSQQELQMQ